MSATPCCQKAASVVGILGAFLVVGLLIYVMKQATPAPALNAERAAERKKALAEIRDVNARAMVTYETVDASNRTVRLAINRAMELTIQEYKNPVTARAGLIARFEKANPAPPPKPPEPAK